jgi:hypothetical protein
MMKHRIGPIVLSVVFSAVSAFAQAVAGLGGLSGVVRDAAGGIVPNTQVVLANDFKGIRRTFLTTDTGIFNFPALPPASGYVVTAAANGFAAFTQRNLEILVGQTVNLNITLEIVAPTTRVEVATGAPIIEEMKTDLSQVVDSRQIQDLPINGRRVDSFVLLTPAVVPDGTFGLLSFRGIPGGNSFLTDGNDTTEQYYNENAGRTRISSQISQDTVQEFQVLAGNYSAEYGRALGGIVNTVTRSGTNDVHGTGYWYFRNRTLDARDRYASLNPPEVRHQGGASFGGPAVRDKLFYFGNFEITRRDFPLLSSLVRPGVVQDGRFVGCGAPATPAQCAAIDGLLPRFFGLLPRTANQELLFGRLDWRPSERNAFSASLNYQRFVSPNGIQTGIALTNGAGLTSNAIDSTRVRYGRLSWTAITTPTIVNEARFGWLKDRQADDPVMAYLGPGLGMRSVTVAGQAIGAPNYLPRIQPSENRFEGADNLTWTSGKHILKFGFNLASTEDFVKQLFNSNGSYVYGSVTDFALDYSGNSTGARRYQTYSQAFGRWIADTTIHDYAFYAQDQFRLTPALTLNYGIRYEFAQLPQPTVFNPAYPQTARIPESRRNFAPRVGIAYSFNQSRTVLRAGYGMFYGRFPGTFLNTMFTSNALFQTSINLNTANPLDAAAGPVFPNALAGSANAQGGSTIAFAAPNLRTPYTQQGDVAIEHQLAHDLGLTVFYNWTRGVHLLTTRDLNIGEPGPSATYTIEDAGGAVVGTYSTPTYLLANRVDKNFQRILQVENGGNSYYNALAVQLRKRFSRGFEGSLAYTWSHAIDYSLGGASNNLFYGSDAPRTIFNGDYRGNKGTSNLDQRHRLVMSFVEQPTFTHRTDAFSRYVVNNWQLSGITTIASAMPATATVLVSRALPGLAFPQTLNGFNGDQRVPFWPVNSLRIDDVTRMDARVSKMLPFHDRFMLSLNFEVFNLTNTISNTAVFTQAFTATSGVLKPTPGLGAGNASAGFPDGTNARRAQLSARLVF